MIIKTKYFNIQSYITKDSSEVRELMHPDIFPRLNQSLAEAILPAGGETILHTHLKSEEIYHITGGGGVMLLGNEKTNIAAGDTIFIPAALPIKSKIPATSPSKSSASAALRIRIRTRSYSNKSSFFMLPFFLASLCHVTRCSCGYWCPKQIIPAAAPYTSSYAKIPFMNL